MASLLSPVGSGGGPGYWKEGRTIHYEFWGPSSNTERSYTGTPISIDGSGYIDFCSISVSIANMDYVDMDLNVDGVNAFIWHRKTDSSSSTGNSHRIFIANCQNIYPVSSNKGFCMPNALYRQNGSGNIKYTDFAWGFSLQQTSFPESFYNTNFLESGWSLTNISKDSPLAITSETATTQDRVRYCFNSGPIRFESNFNIYVNGWISTVAAVNVTYWLDA